MTLKQLEYFSAVARTLNFTEAARQLYISQPALSRSLRALEEEIGVSLLIRDRHRVTLTDAGSVFYKQIPRLNADLSHMVVEAQQAESGHLGRLRLGVLDGIPSVPAARAAIRHFLQYASTILLQPVCLTQEEVIYALHTEELDVGITYDIADMPYDSLLERVFLDTGQYAIAVSKASPLAEADCVSLRNLQREKFFFANTESSFEVHRWKEIFARNGIMPLIANVINIGTLTFCVENGMGIAILPHQHRLFSSPYIRQVHMEETIPLNILLCWARNNTNPSLEFFLESFLTQVPNSGTETD